MKKLTFCVSKAVRFSWKWARLTLKVNPPIYHWLWFSFSYYDHEEWKKDNWFRKVRYPQNKLEGR
jgi:hypothetical protein